MRRDRLKNYVMRSMCLVYIELRDDEEKNIKGISHDEADWLMS